jgi:hypothetical protein
LWHAVEEDLQFILSHPNGWEGAVHGGLILDTDAGKARIRFVTEGEASLHACALNGLAKETLTIQGQFGHGFLVADAGGGTLDISSYAVCGTTPLVMEEIAPPDCPLSSALPDVCSPYSCFRRFCWVCLRQSKGCASLEGW